MADVQELTVEEFDALLAEGGVALTDLFADWCGPCRMMAPVVEKLAAAYDGRVRVAKVNVDEAPEIAVRYGVESIPTLLLFKDGERQETLIGVRPYEDLCAALDALL